MYHRRSKSGTILPSKTQSQIITEDINSRLGHSIVLAVDL